MIKELTISGGGVRGIAFVSALYELEKQKLLDVKKLQKISGTSIGIFIAFCLVSGYSSKELLDELFQYDFSKIKDIDFDNMFTNKSILKGNELTLFFKTILKKQISLETTLIELYHQTKTECIATTCCLNTSSVEYISYKTHPDLTVLKCIQMSTAIPGILPPIVYMDKLYIDGGIIDNTPLSVLSKNAWGIKTKSNEKKMICTNNISFVQYFKTIMKLIYNTKTKQAYTQENIINIDVGNVAVTAFNISIDEKYTLIRSGINGVKSFLESKSSYVEFKNEKLL